MPARPLLLAAAALVLGLVAGACGGDQPSAAGPGELAYRQHCASCHGDRRQGVGTVPALPPSTIVALGRPGAEAIIRNGKGAMPAFGTVLSDAELTALLRYLETGTG